MMFRRMNTLFVKIIAIFACATFVTLTALQVMSLLSSIDNYREGTAQEARSITGMVSMQIGGAIKFGNKAAVDPRQRRGIRRRGLGRCPGDQWQRRDPSFVGFRRHRGCRGAAPSSVAGQTGARDRRISQ